MSDEKHFDNYEFQAMLTRAKAGIERILDSKRDPILTNPAETNHTYEDKFALANHLTNSLIGSLLNVLAFIGVSQGALEEMKKWSLNRSVTLRLQGEYRCSLVEEREKEVETPELVRETKILGIKSKKSIKAVTKVTEWEWEIAMNYELFAYEGNDLEKKVVFQSRAGKSRLVTSSKVAPSTPVKIVPATVNITWLLQQLKETNLELGFAIDREAEGCCTPRRNKDIQSALSFASAFKHWCREVEEYFHGALWKLDESVKSLGDAVWRNEIVFIPLIPLFMEPESAKNLERKLSRKKSSSKSSSSNTLSVSSTSEPKRSRSRERTSEKKEGKKGRSRSRSRSRERSQNSKVPLLAQFAGGTVPSTLLPKFFEEHVRSLTEAFGEVRKTVSVQKSLISTEEAIIMNCMRHVQTICKHYRVFVDFIENMLLTQIVEAIGQEVTPVDFANYMRYHNRNLFAPDFAPMPFSYAIRRPDHSPVGHISIEEELYDGTPRQPIHTIVRHMRPKQPMRFALNAATDVTFYGDHYLHGYLRHQFSSHSPGSLSLFARTREFSSFVVMVGKMLASDLFEPACAIILKNKDELEIPLELTTIPSAKAFKKAVSSLSEEQKRFSQAIRNMQLEGSLFGICIIQIQPQMERLLNLPKESLLKEIELSEQIQNLFIHYQIPSDMLTYEEDDDLPDSAKVATVRTYVQEMNNMIHGRKETETKEAQLEHCYAAGYSLQSSSASDGSECSDSEDVSVTDVNDTCVRLLECEEEEDDDECEEFNDDFLSSVESDACWSFEPVVQKQLLSIDEMAFSCNEMAMPVKDTVMSPALSVQRSPIQPVEKKQEEPRRRAKDPFEEKSKPVDAKKKVARGSDKKNEPKPTDSKPAEGKSKENTEPDHMEIQEVEETDLLDYTNLPAELDKQFLKLDPDGAVCATTITPASSWNKTSKATLNSRPVTNSLYEDEQMEEKRQAFELLDALSRSGALDIDADNASFHILLGFTHIFDQTLIDSLVKQNVNPIEKVERSNLIVASSIHKLGPAEIVDEEELERVSTYNPILFSEQ